MLPKVKPALRQPEIKYNSVNCGSGLILKDTLAAFEAQFRISISADQRPVSTADPEFKADVSFNSSALEISKHFANKQFGAGFMISVWE